MAILYWLSYKRPPYLNRQDIIVMVCVIIMPRLCYLICRAMQRHNKLLMAMRFISYFDQQTYKMNNLHQLCEYALS